MSSGESFTPLSPQRSVTANVIDEALKIYISLPYPKPPALLPVKVHPSKVAVEPTKPFNERAPPLCTVPRMTEETGEYLYFGGKSLHILKATYTKSRNAIVLRSIGRKLTG